VLQYEVSFLSVQQIELFVTMVYVIMTQDYLKNTILTSFWRSRMTFKGHLYTHTDYLGQIFILLGLVLSSMNAQ